MLGDYEIAANMDSIKRVFSAFLTFGDGPTDALMVNNAEWLDDLRYIPFLRQYGSQFSVNRMLGLESVKARLDRQQPLTFLEFNYMVLQAYDFLELCRRHDCTVQMGGSDQWGNIVGGVELGRRVDGLSLYGLTTPLLTTASGAKMGKTAKGAVWLNEDLVSAYDYWQYWRNTEDADVGRFLRLFTELPLDEIARLEALEEAEINEAKKILATEATEMCHGEAAAATAQATAQSTFEDGAIGDQLPTVDLSLEALKTGFAAFDILYRAGLTATKSEARRLIKAGGARLNDTVIGAETQMIGFDDINNGVIKLSAGKKRHAVVRAV
jgi:tyrosyl-tRNA synthetase